MGDFEECDFAIVGAGTAGCVVANRLSESGRDRVLLIEAGGSDRNPWIHIPIGYGRLFDDPTTNWRYESEPEPALNGRTLYQPRGKVLGGTSSINGQLYTRGPREDFDRWRDLGNPGWGFVDVLPFFKRSENRLGNAETYYGVGGPLAVSDPPAHHELADAFVGAVAEAGYPVLPDFNGQSHEGAGYFRLTVRGGRRCSAAVGYLHPVSKRKNLAVLTDCLATRVLFDGAKAVGIEYRQAGKLQRCRVRREVILCGGVFNSPQLLQLSGIGPAEHLRYIGVSVIRDAPAVGANLQDHFMVSMVYRCAKPVTLNDALNGRLRRVMAGVRYALNRSGPLAANGTYVGAYLRTDASRAYPNLQLNLAQWSVANNERSRTRLQPFPGFSVGVINLRPESRGAIRIKSTDPSVAPEIRFNFFCADDDRQVMLQGLRTARRILTMPAMRPYVADEEMPGHACTTNGDLIAYCRERGRSTLHPAGTCQMGSHAHAVVDPRLRVRGITGLRIIDGSIMPVLVSANPMAATVMIAEKGAAMILEGDASCSV